MDQENTSEDSDIEYRLRLQELQILNQISDEDLEGQVVGLEDYSVDLTSLPERVLSTEIHSKLGDLTSITGNLVLVTAQKSPSIIANINTVVVLENGVVVGKIVEILGPVSNPIYLICAKPEFLASAELGETLFFAGDITVASTVEEIRKASQVALRDEMDGSSDDD